MKEDKNINKPIKLLEGLIKYYEKKEKDYKALKEEKK